MKKLRFTLLFLLFLCYLEVSAQTPCTKYAATIAVVNQQLAKKNPDAQLTFNKLRAARVHARDCGSAPAGEVDQKLKALFDKLEALKISADRNSRALKKEQQNLRSEKERSEALRLVADEERVKADSLRSVAQAAAKKAEAVLDKIYFYDGEYGLAIENKGFGLKYGFINKKLETKIDFVYDEAQAFDNRGFTRVSRKGQAYMIDTTGKEYVYATALTEINEKTALLDLRGQIIEEIPVLAIENPAMEVVLADELYGLVQVKGLVQFPKLKLLFLNKTGVDDLSSIAGLTNLTYLDLRITSVVDLSLLSGLTNLTHLNLDDTRVKDLSPLAGMTNLTHLYLSRIGLVDLNPLLKLTNLTYLNLSGANVKDLSPLLSLTNLTHLYLNFSRVVLDLSPLAGLKNLTNLGLSDTRVKDLSPLAGLTNLTNLGLGSTKIVDLSPLGGLTNLTDLNLSNTEIVDLSPLIRLKNLTHLRFGYTPNITLSQIKIIQAALPDCDISHDKGE